MGRSSRSFVPGVVWNEDQGRLYERLLRRESVEPVRGLSMESQTSGWEAAGRYLPALLKAAFITIVLSCLSMGLAVVVGVLIACGRVYGTRRR